MSIVIILNDLIAPTLSGETVEATGENTAQITATTDKDNGTAYWVVTQSATAPSATQIQNGEDENGSAADADSSASVTETDISLPVTGLSGSTTYYAYLVQVDVSGNVSGVAEAGSFTTETETTPPNLSAPVLTALSASTMTVGVTTDEGNGTWYWYVSTSATPPSATDLKNGTGAVDSGSKAIGSTGAKTDTASGLSADTTYYQHSLHRDAAGNDSSIVTSASADTWPAKPGTITLTAGTSSWTAVKAVEFYRVRFTLNGAGGGGGGGGINSNNQGGSPAACTITINGTTYSAGGGEGGYGRNAGGGKGAGGTASNGDTNTSGADGEDQGKSPDNYGGAGGGDNGGPRNTDTTTGDGFAGEDATGVRGGGAGGLRNIFEGGGGGGGEGAQCIKTFDPGDISEDDVLSCSIPTGGVGSDGYLGSASKGGDGFDARITIVFLNP